MSKLEFRLGNTNNHPWTAVAFGELGVAEVNGVMSNLHIIKYLESVAEMADDGIPWCAAFAQWCLKQAGVFGANSSGAKDWLGWGEILDEPEYGCITIFKVASQGNESYHVGFMFGKEGDRIRLLGGNQSHKVSIAKLPIHGLLHTMRGEYQYDVMGYRWPSYVPLQ
jgi:uncharacterized protein (TIGR02594 family)